MISNSENERATSVKKESKKNNNIIIRFLFYGFALFFFLHIFRYYLTGAGGPTLLAVSMIPVAYIITTLNSMLKGEFYPNLHKNIQYVLGTIYIIISLIAAIYISVEFDDIRIIRLGIWNTKDIVIGTAMVILVLEYARRKFFPIFVLNILLIFYCVYGWMIPGMFNHPGLRWIRVFTSMSVEMTTGIYSRLPQLSLTLILPFMMILGILRGFGCINSILKWTLRLATKSVHALPQSAVIGSFAVATVSGSGPANAATTGSITIPALIQAGFPRVKAASIETACSLGGQLMPPVMGIAAFIMADFLGVGYFDVLARGFGPALVYFAGVGTAVYLLTGKYIIGTSKDDSGSQLKIPELELIDKANILAFIGIIVSLIYLMGRYRMEPMIAAVRVFFGLLVFLLLILIYRSLKNKEYRHYKELIKPFRSSIDAFTDLGAELVILLALLGILAGTLTITGIPTKIGRLLVVAANFHVIATVAVAFVFGYLLGMGLPPAPVYTMVAIAVAPAMVNIGLERWAVHFFAFFLGVFGHLSPPTSLTAAVTSKIAGSDYTQTIFNSLELCIPLLILMPAVFTRSDLVVELGFLQFHAFILVLMGTLGIVFSIHCKYSPIKLLNILLKLILLIFSFLALFYPDIGLANISILPIIAFIIYGFIRTRKGIN
jgi:TRAP transporter 4TM/12TM fusion protein